MVLNMQSASTGRRSKHMQVQALITRSGQSTHLASLKLARDVDVVTVVVRVGVGVGVVVVVVVGLVVRATKVAAAPVPAADRHQCAR